MTADVGPGREPIPPGEVSTIRGRYQAPALRAAMGLALLLSAVELLSGGAAHDAFGIAAVAIVAATPLLRVVWLTFRWTQEHDRHFVVLSLLLLGVIALGAGLAVVGVG